MSAGYSCNRDDWEFLAVEIPEIEGAKDIVGVQFEDGHKIYFKDCPRQQADAYLRARGFTRDRHGKISWTPGDN